MTNETVVNDHSDLTGRTIGRTNARLITPEEMEAVFGGLIATSSVCVCVCGRDCGGVDE